MARMCLLALQLGWASSCATGFSQVFITSEEVKRIDCIVVVRSLRALMVDPIGEALEPQPHSILRASIQTIRTVIHNSVQVTLPQRYPQACDKYVAESN